MIFDLRNHGIPTTPFLIVLNDRIVRRVVAFDTDAGTVERLAGVDSLVPLDGLEEHLRSGYGDFRGLATLTEHGTIQVWGPIERQDDLDAQTGRWA